MTTLMKKLFAVIAFSCFTLMLAAHDVNITCGPSTVKTVSEAISKQTGILFSFQKSIGELPTPALSVNLKNASIEDVCKAAFGKSNVRWNISGNLVDLLRTEDAGQTTKKQEQEAQDTKIRITGTVVDIQDKQPLIGVVVRPKSQPQTGSSTDLNGLYVIEAKKGDILIYSYLGYSDLEVPVTGESVLDVTMSLNNEVLSEATVVGFGTQKKISVIGSQQNISTSDLKAPVANLTQSIAGRVAGVVSMQRSGEPGFDDATIYIRGISTLTASMSAPLTIVDGVPRSISNIDPEDIESFTVLKDASATAVYGVRGANGVIIINTKGGKTGKPKFDIRYTEGITQFTTLPSFVDAPTYMRLSNEALQTRGEARRYSDAEIHKTETGADPFLYPNVDWMKLLFMTSTTLRSAGVNAMAGLTAGINAGRSGVISAMRSAARAAVNAAKSELKIHSPSEVFEDEVGVMTMRGFGQGVLKESKEQARVIRNASRFLTGEAKNSAIAYSSSDNRRTYNNSVNSTIQVAQMVIRDEQDIRSLAVEIATLTRRQQRGKGLRMT